MSALMEKARQAQHNALHSQRSALQAQAAEGVVTGRDLILFRRGMYNPSADGSFVFEGCCRNARRVHEETQDRDTDISRIITEQRKHMTE